MNGEIQILIRRLTEEHSLSTEEYRILIENRDEDAAKTLAEAAVKVRKEIYGNEVFTRGLIEISNYCKNDCYYCGIRRGNKNCERYRLEPDVILECADLGYKLGYRTIVMQGGEDAFFKDDVMCGLIRQIKECHPDVAVTLSLGERSRESYQAMFDAGADRYLLRHETANEAHYQKLHPDQMSFKKRMECLKTLKEIGYQVGAGMMVGSPFQTSRHLAEDLKFIEEFKPDMCGIGPFIPHHDTPFKNEPQGSVELTCFLLSVIRLIHPPILLPATTALGTIDPLGREKGILSGANVIMPNLSPVDVRRQYELYDNKICTGEESAECRGCLENRMNRIGYVIAQSRGDVRKTN
ncbi:MAG: [Parasporobacterium sp.]|nr:[FeFe] hydrogenase H-cluster radical SAM maturase HydE [Parasporobacterium sp.]